MMEAMREALSIFLSFFLVFYLSGLYIFFERDETTGKPNFKKVMRRSIFPAFVIGLVAVALFVWL